MRRPVASLRLPQSRSLRLRTFASILVCAAVSACGGGSTTSGGVHSVSTAPPPAPPAAEPPAPINFDTAEFRRSDGPEFHGALSAWNEGATGAGSIIAVIDSGIDSDSPEFAGRIHPDSRDVAGDRALDGEDDHGTNVAMVAAAARDDRGVLGIAFDAQVLALRADMPGSCGADTTSDPTLGCVFNDSGIANGIDQAVASGAAVINLSLGGGHAAPRLVDAVRAAAQAGIVVVVAAGNGGDGSEPGVDPDQPDRFATSLLEAGGGHVIIVGSVDADGGISSFSNRAGNAASSYITARGERICCVYEDGEVLSKRIDGSEFVTLFSGTSFAAPQVSGAVALLAQAFPNLTGAEIVEILLATARDAGVAGLDPVYGAGILDIAAAMRPVGMTRLAGGNSELALADDFAIGSMAMGDSLANAGLGAVVTDTYDRAYTIDLGARSRHAAQVRRLTAAVGESGLRRAAGGGGLSLAVTVDGGERAAGLGWSQELQLTGEEAIGAQVLAAQVAARIAPEIQVGFALSQGAGGLIGQMQGADHAAFVIAPQAGRDAGFIERGDFALASRFEMAGWGFTVSAQTGNAWLGELRQASDVAPGLREQRPTTTFAIAADRTWRGFEGSASLSWLGEEETVLGAFFNPAFGVAGADTAFLDGRLSHRVGSEWRLGAAFRAGMTRPRSGGMVGAGSRIASNAWSFDLIRYGAILRGDSVGLRISQPLRVSGGTVRFDLPTSYDYATETAIMSSQALSLRPEGREVMGELAWQAELAIGTLSTSLFFRSQPGHFRSAPDDLGAVVRLGSRF